jgi:hypothetical protein
MSRENFAPSKPCPLGAPWRDRSFQGSGLARKTLLSLGGTQGAKSVFQRYGWRS